MTVLSNGTIKTLEVTPRRTVGLLSMNRALYEDEWHLSCSPELTQRPGTTADHVPGKFIFPSQALTARNVGRWPQTCQRMGLELASGH